MTPGTLIALVVIVLATLAFMWYDSRKKRRQEPNYYSPFCAAYKRTEDGHHQAHPGCLGHPAGCGHMMTLEQIDRMIEEDLGDNPEGIDRSR